MVKSGDGEPWLKSRLHRNLGQLAAAKNSLSEARKHFAEDVSWLSLCWMYSDTEPADLPVQCSLQPRCYTNIRWLLSLGPSIPTGEKNRHSNFPTQSGEQDHQSTLTNTVSVIFARYWQLGRLTFLLCHKKNLALRDNWVIICCFIMFFSSLAKKP